MRVHPSIPIESAPTHGGRAAGAPARLTYVALLAMLLAATVFEVVEHGHWGAALAGGLGPDLALLLGGGAGLVPGQLHARAVPLYNALHRFSGPVALLAAASLGLLGGAWLIAGLAWAAHVALDRAVGYGLRTEDGFQRGA
ncbi:MAG: hypothetical protein QOH46_3861 [Solirubrobacteraceae bacterium]|nr:hypothetical protein [Solirubrobacteraceae bacterium]